MSRPDASEGVKGRFRTADAIPVLPANCDAGQGIGGKTLTCDSVPPLCPLVVLLDGASRCQFRLVSPEKRKRVAPLILLGETHFESGGRWEIRTLDPYRVKVML